MAQIKLNEHSTAEETASGWLQATCVVLGLLFGSITSYLLYLYCSQILSIWIVLTCRQRSGYEEI